LIIQHRIGKSPKQELCLNTAAIAARAEELVSKYPEQSALFEEYVISQLEESDDMTDRVVSAMWVLQKENVGV
jgi:hypothetical protein